MFNPLGSFHPIQTFTNSSIVLELINSPLSKKIQSMALPSFKTGSAFFFTAYGTIELHQNYVKGSSGQRKDLTFLSTHGAMLLGTGVCNGLEALHTFSILNLKSLYYPLSSLGGFLFLFANLIALEENISVYEQFRIHMKDPNCQEDAYLNGRAAMWGMLSNIGYITAAALAIFGLSTAIALLIGVISACFGSLKILYDFLALSKAG